jgi:hypothetical protein
VKWSPLWLYHKIDKKKHWDSDPGSLESSFILSLCWRVRVRFLGCVLRCLVFWEFWFVALSVHPRLFLFLEIVGYPRWIRIFLLFLLLSWSLKFRFLLKFSLIVTSILWQVLLNKCVSDFRLLRLLALASSVLMAFLRCNFCNSFFKAFKAIFPSLFSWFFRSLSLRIYGPWNLGHPADYRASKRKNRFIFFSFFQFLLSSLVTSLFWPWVLRKKENFALCWCSVVNIWSPYDMLLLISEWTLFGCVLFLNDFCGVVELLSFFCLVLLQIV